MRAMRIHAVSGHPRNFIPIIPFAAVDLKPIQHADIAAIMLGRRIFAVKKRAAEIHRRAAVRHLENALNHAERVRFVLVVALRVHNLLPECQPGDDIRIGEINVPFQQFRHFFRPDIPEQRVDNRQPGLHRAIRRSLANRRDSGGAECFDDLQEFHFRQMMILRQRDARLLKQVSIIVNRIGQPFDGKEIFVFPFKSEG